MSWVFRVLSSLGAFWRAVASISAYMEYMKTREQKQDERLSELEASIEALHDAVSEIAVYLGKIGRSLKP